MPDTPSQAALDVPKGATHREFCEAFRAWFMESLIDFWDEADAPEALATIAVEISDRFAASPYERGVIMGMKLTDDVRDRLSRAEAVIAAAKRARKSLRLLIRELPDPGAEALAAEWELGNELAAYRSDTPKEGA